jgi:hypothetical protein
MPGYLVGTSLTIPAAASSFLAMAAGHRGIHYVGSSGIKEAPA